MNESIRNAAMTVAAVAVMGFMIASLFVGFTVAFLEVAGLLAGFQPTREDFYASLTVNAIGGLLMALLIAWSEFKNSRRKDGGEAVPQGSSDA